MSPTLEITHLDTLNLRLKNSLYVSIRETNDQSLRKKIQIKKPESIETKTELQLQQHEKREEGTHAFLTERT